MATESWECVEESAPHSESEDACGSTVSYAYSVCGSASEGTSRTSSHVPTFECFEGRDQRGKQKLMGSIGEFLQEANILPWFRILIESTSTWWKG